VAASTSEINARVEAALSRFYAQDPNHRELANKASAMLVFPSVTSRRGCRRAEVWRGSPAGARQDRRLLQANRGIRGATLGVARRSEVLLFMTGCGTREVHEQQGLDGRVDAGVAVVKGAGAQYDSETLRKPVVAFVFGEKGLIADVSLEGAKVTKLPQ